MNMKLDTAVGVGRLRFVANFVQSSGRSEAIQGQMGKHWTMDMKLGGWGRFMMPTILKVISRSPRVIQGQVGRDMEFGGWGQLFMPKMFKVTSRSSGVMGKHQLVYEHEIYRGSSKVKTLVYGH